MKPSPSISKPSIALVLVALIALVSAGFIANPPPAEALTLSQCNGTDNVGGQAVECHYEVTNNLNGSVTSSTVELTECHGFANAPATMKCTSSTTSSPDLITSVEQCNGSGNGSLGTVTCTVKVVNNITATVTATPATVNQCDGSGTGGGALPLNCNPYQTTTSATVTQCNGSGNGGGATQRVNCSVDSSSTTTSLLPVTVNQCNVSGNGGGGFLVCSAQLTDVITAPAPSPSPSQSVSPSPSPVAPPPPNPPNPNPPPPNPPPPNPPPDPTPSATPTPTPSATATAGPNPDVTPTPSISPTPDTTLEPDENIGGDDGEVGGTGGGGLNGAGGGGDATGGGGANGGEGLRGGGGRGDGPSRGVGTGLTGGATTTGQVTHVPDGGANTGGGSTSGIENPRLLLLGFMLLGAVWPALVVRRRAVARDEDVATA